jgi:hypothetical protein
MGKDKGVKKRQAGLADQIIQEEQVKASKRTKHGRKKSQKEHSEVRIPDCFRNP